MRWSLMPAEVWKVLNGTPAERRARKRVQRWARLGSEIFCCDPVYLYRLWITVRHSPLTMEEISMHTESLGELAKAGWLGATAGKEMRRMILEANK